VDTQNNSHWTTENPHFILEILLCNVELGFCCTRSLRTVIGHVFYAETVNTDKYVGNILQLTFSNWHEEKLYGYFQNHSASVHIAEHSLQTLNREFSERVVTCCIWPPHYSIIIQCDFSLWEYLKDEVTETNPHIEGELWANVHLEVSYVFRELFGWCWEYITVSGEYYWHLT
jgi:hypothetical protein